MSSIPGPIMSVDMHLLYLYNLLLGVFHGGFFLGHYCDHVKGMKEIVDRFGERENTDRALCNYLER